MTTYTHKDGHKCYWKVTIVESDWAKKPDLENDKKCEFLVPNGDHHNSWEIEVSIDEKLVFSDIIHGQYDSEPSLIDVLSKFQNYINRSCMNFAKYE